MIFRNKMTLFWMSDQNHFTSKIKTKWMKIWLFSVLSNEGQVMKHKSLGCNENYNLILFQ